MQLQTERTRNLLNKKIETKGDAAFPKTSFNIPNNWAGFDAEQIKLWETVCNGLGINFADTGYTLRAAKGKKDGAKFNIYQPTVQAQNDQAVLVWGNVCKPLDEITATGNVTINLVTGEQNKNYLEFYFGNLKEDLIISMMIPGKDNKELKPDQKKFHDTPDANKAALLKNALRKGSLHLYLSDVYVLPLPLVELEGQTLTVVDYKLNSYQKYILLTLEKGWVKTNTEITNQLLFEPTISRDAPATLKVFKSVNKTAQGHPIVPVSFVTHYAANLEDIDFDVEEDNNGNSIEDEDVYTSQAVDPEF